jgi:hypothetical protein
MPPALLGCKHCVPDGVRSSIPKSQPVEIELLLADPQEQFDPRVILAVLKRLNPSIGPITAMVLFGVSRQNSASAFISRTARCDAAWPSNVTVRGLDPCPVIAVRKNAMARQRHAWGLRRKPTVLPSVNRSVQINSLAADPYTSPLNC